METRRWTNPSQPQTLQIAVFLLYANAVMTVIFGAWAVLILAAIVGAVGAYGIANSRTWGYHLAVGAAAVEVGLVVLVPLAFLGIDLLFDPTFMILSIIPVALFCLLVHPQSREHQRIWFD
jgi:hypothetical protein